jgi:hypothetical protein
MDRELECVVGWVILTMLSALGILMCLVLTVSDRMR